jgi:hypothetical protein
MKIKKIRWDILCRVYEIDAGNGIIIYITMGKDGKCKNWLAPTINISATGNMNQAKAYRYLGAVRKALALAERIQA